MNRRQLLAAALAAPAAALLPTTATTTPRVRRVVYRPHDFVDGRCRRCGVLLPTMTGSTSAAEPASLAA